MKNYKYKWAKKKGMKTKLRLYYISLFTYYGLIDPDKGEQSKQLRRLLK